MPTMRYRRLRGDKIETYIILEGRYDNHAVPALRLSAEGNLRGNMLKLRINRTKYFFSNRIVNVPGME